MERGPRRCLCLSVASMRARVGRRELGAARPFPKPNLSKESSEVEHVSHVLHTPLARALHLARGHGALTHTARHILLHSAPEHWLHVWAPQRHARCPEVRSHLWRQFPLRSRPSPHREVLQVGAARRPPTHRARQSRQTIRRLLGGLLECLGLPRRGRTWQRGGLFVRLLGKRHARGSRRRAPSRRLRRAPRRGVGGARARVGGVRGLGRTPRSRIGCSTLVRSQRGAWRER